MKKGAAGKRPERFLYRLPGRSSLGRGSCGEPTSLLKGALFSITGFNVDGSVRVRVSES